MAWNNVQILLVAAIALVFLSPHCSAQNPGNNDAVAALLNSQIAGGGRVQVLNPHVALVDLSDTLSQRERMKRHFARRILTST